MNFEDYNYRSYNQHILLTGSDEQFLADSNSSNFHSDDENQSEILAK